jgi:hypothetical protein
MHSARIDLIALCQNMTSARFCGRKVTRFC